MNAVQALSRLRALGTPAIHTADASAALGLGTPAASVTLARLARAGLVRRVRHGLWWLEERLEASRLPEFLTAPLPSYVSLQSALHAHGLIEQIPSVTYAVTLARTQRVTTNAGTVSLHHLDAELFGGFETTAHGVQLATAEKALFDVAYLSGGRSRLFSALPELEVPRGFRRTECDRWVARIASQRLRTLVAARLDGWLSARAGSSGPTSRRAPPPGRSGPRAALRAPRTATRGR